MSSSITATKKEDPLNEACTSVRGERERSANKVKIYLVVLHLPLDRFGLNVYFFSGYTGWHVVFGRVFGKEGASFRQQRLEERGICVKPPLAGSISVDSLHLQSSASSLQTDVD